MNYRDGQFDRGHLLKMKRGIELFNAKKFWECHEELEGHWIEAGDNPSRYVYWAVIQVATSLVHYHNGRLSGARGQIEKAKEKFGKIKGSVHLLEEHLCWSLLKSLVWKIPSDAKLEDFHALSQFTFKDPSRWALESFP